MTIYFFVVFGVYFSIVIALWVGWQLTFEKVDSKKATTTPGVSVVIPYRNELSNLRALLESLLTQNYPKDQLEIILVDDHSTDASSSIVAEFAARFPNLKNVRLDEHATGKKKALAFGIQTSSYDLIVTTDADCTHDPGWISAVTSCFDKNDVVMAVGGVRIDSSSGLFAKIQALEFTSLVGTTASTLFYQQPTMCNGANLAFRKKAFLDVGGYDGNYEIASGDDEFLMRKIHARFRGGIVFMLDQTSVVTTQPSATLKSFLHQRIRWAGKWKYNSSIGAKLLAVFVLVFQLSYVLLPIAGWCHWVMPERVYFLMVVKVTLEFMLLYPVTFFLQVRWRWIPFLILQVVYPFYVVGIGLLAQRQVVSWKERVI
ncbi:MAG: glycosyltransferase [Cyclobacteriaceae bacterium]|nr:glycosyltransferase [Cyclobacteriaceae bacterium]